MEKSKRYVDSKLSFPLTYYLVDKYTNLVELKQCSVQLVNCMPPGTILENGKISNTKPILPTTEYGYLDHSGRFKIEPPTIPPITYEHNVHVSAKSIVQHKDKQLVIKDSYSLHPYTTAIIDSKKYKDYIKASSYASAEFKDDISGRLHQHDWMSVKYYDSMLRYITTTGKVPP